MSAALVLPSSDSPEDVGTISELNQTGDIKFTWNRKNSTEVAAAKEYFDSMRKKGFLVFKVRRILGSSGDQVTRFDPKVSGLIFKADPSAQTRAPETEVAQDFDPKADYVTTPAASGG